MAENLAKRWLNAGHSVSFGSRNPEVRRAVVELLGPGADVASHEQAIRASEVVVLGLPYADCESFVRDHSGLLKGKVLVDVTNPFGITPPDGLSGPEVTQRAAGTDVNVVAAFKTNHASTLTHPIDASGVQHDVFYCGDDTASKAIVHGLIVDLGLRPVDAGPLKSGYALDLMVPLMIEMDRRLGGKGLARRSHWKFVTP